MTRTVVWFSCGAASAVAAKMTLRDNPEAVVAYCETRSEHPDNERFMTDCQHWFGKSVTRISSTQFHDTWDVWERERYLAGINGASCTRALKFRPRLAWQQPSDIHVFGYTADKRDMARALAMRENYPEMELRTPLIKAEITKASCLALIDGAGIKIPVMYGLGFHNNNCVPCVKAQSPSYWALIRKEFPIEFDRMVKLSRSLNVRLCKIKGERRFIDEVPLDQATTNAIAPACDFLCNAVADEWDDGEAVAHSTAVSKEG